MMMPKLDFHKATMILKELSNDKAATEKYMDAIVNEQDKEFIVLFCLAGVVNPNAMKGFVVAYTLIREGLLARDIVELDKLIK